MEPGKPRHEGYTYERSGTAVALMAYNIHTGERRVEVRERRTSNDYAEFMQALADSQPEAKTIRIIEDNLNIHKDGSFYTRFHHEEARRLSQKIRHIYTPKHASWLNIIKIEFLVLTRQCLDRRIATIKLLRQEILTWAEKRNATGVRVEWQFTTPKARRTFQKACHDICRENPTSSLDCIGEWRLPI
jgi:DDE superfamily endonuclease